MKNIAILLLVTISGFLFGQQQKKDVYEYKTPRNLEQCFEILGKTLTEEELNVIKNFPEYSIAEHEEFKHGSDFFHAWDIYGDSKITKYFNKKGLIGSNEIYNTILISYHRHLNNKPIDLEAQILKCQAKQKIEYEEYIIRTKKDSIDGVYIPINLEDFFKTLNQILKVEDINAIKALKSREDVIQYHHGFGTWLRNSWGLWGGSRLKQYLYAKGITHPDDMSHTILQFYYDWLHNNHSEWKKFERI